MIEGHEKFKLKDEKKINDFTLEVNWDLKNDKVNQCKMVKLVFPNGDESYIKTEHLHAILFAIGNREDQMKMIPQVKRTMKEYETVVQVKVTRDIRKGEQVIFPIKLRLPEPDEKVIGGLTKMESVKSKNILLTK